MTGLDCLREKRVLDIFQSTARHNSDLSGNINEELAKFKKQDQMFCRIFIQISKAAQVIWGSYGYE